MGVVGGGGYVTGEEREKGERGDIERDQEVGGGVERLRWDTGEAASL